MVLPPENNYSILNNYNYQGKSKWMAGLDWLSSPCRRILGGRDIYISSLRYGAAATTAEKVTTIFFSVLIFPIAIVSIASLLIKHAASGLWEKKKVKTQAKQTREIINTFKDCYQKNDFQGAIQAYKKRPQIGQRGPITKKLFTAVNKIVNNGTDWSEVQTCICMLSNQDAIEMLNHAIKERLKTDPSIEANAIIQLIQHSLKGRSLAQFKACYKKVLQNALLIDGNHDVTVNALKLDLAEQLICSLEKLKNLNSDKPFEAKLFAIESNTLRAQLFKKGQDHGHLPFLFSGAEERKQICATAKNIRVFTKLQNALKNAQQTDWNQVRNACIAFQTNLGTLPALLEKEEQQYIQSTQNVVGLMTKAIDAVQQGRSTEEIDKQINAAVEGLSQHQKHVGPLLRSLTPSPSAKSLEAFPHKVHLKQIEYLLNAEQAAVRSLQKHAEKNPRLQKINTFQPAPKEVPVLLHPVFLFDVTEEEKQICAAIQLNKKSAQAYSKLRNVLGNASLRPTTEKEWNEACEACKEFLTDLNNLLPFVEKNEKETTKIQAIHEVGILMIQAIEELKRDPSSLEKWKRDLEFKVPKNYRLWNSKTPKKDNVLDHFYFQSRLASLESLNPAIQTMKLSLVMQLAEAAGWDTPKNIFREIYDIMESMRSSDKSNENLSEQFALLELTLNRAKSR